MPFRAFPRSKKSPGTPNLFGASEKLPEGHLLAHVDGGARGNPGPAGYGVAIADDAGRPVAALSRYLGHQTNNYAEYMGLLAALHYALEHGCKALEVVSDSELLVRQMNGQYKVRAPQLIGLYQEAKALAARLDVFRVRHVRREHNREADALANRAMDEGMGRR
jgi:ribonuclease HI